jgi:putative endopeptidase
MKKIIIPALLISACGLFKKTETPQEVVTQKNDYQALQLEHFDHSVAPQEDIYNHVNGLWMKNTEIPADRGRWGSFDELRQKADDQTFEVLEEAMSSGKYDANTPQGKAVIIYKGYLDTAKRNVDGIGPLLPYLIEIEGLNNVTDIDLYAKKHIKEGGNPFIGFGVGADIKNSNTNVVYAGGGSLGLPERDYYFDTSSRGKEIRLEYVKFINKMFRHFYPTGYDNIGSEILSFETKLAEAKMTKEARRNPYNRYNIRTVDQLSKIFPQFDIKSYLRMQNLNTENVIVGDTALMNRMSELVNDNQIALVKKYILWNEINGSTSRLDMKLDELNFDFYGKFLRGTPQQRPLKERALAAANGALGEALGQLYVAKFFPPEAKEQAVALVANLKLAYEKRINAVDWMSPETKIKAVEKLKAITVKIGYPDKWTDYSALNLKPAEKGGTYFENQLALGRWSIAKNLSEYGKPVDKTEWGMSPQTVNAYYNPVYNEIVFPAAILQAPFFDYRADAAVNYGGIGAVIGHEISHGFDDQGARYDAKGNLNNWWTEEDLKQFQERGEALAAQFDKYEALPGKFVNGKFTLGENIGDLGGINSAYDALQLAIAKDPTLALELDGYSPNQRFFLSWCTIWRGKMRDGELETRLKTDPHSPGYFRAIGPPSNMDAFYELFNVNEGDAMYRKPENRVKIW